jgi:hypothetical protein
MDNQISRRLRAGLIAASLSAALMIGGSVVASAQQQDQDRHAPEAANPAQTAPAQSLPGDNNAQSPAATTPQTAPDQDNGVRPAPNKDRDMQANPADHDNMKAKSEASENSAAGKKQMRQDVKEFDSFLDSNPKIARDLKEDPSKVNDQAWVSQHPELDNWLKEHKNVREEIKENPSAFMNREKAYDKNESATPKQ